MSLSIGMIMSPKVEIFSQLVCRAIAGGPEDHTPNTIAIPPVLARASPAEFERDDVARFVTQASASPFKFENWDSASDDSWAKQCRKKPEVQKAVASLVRPPSS